MGVVLGFIKELLQSWLTRCQARRECGVSPSTDSSRDLSSTVQPHRADTYQTDRTVERVDISLIGLYGKSNSGWCQSPFHRSMTRNTHTGLYGTVGLNPREVHLSLRQREIPLPTNREGNCGVLITWNQYEWSGIMSEPTDRRVGY